MTDLTGIALGRRALVVCDVDDVVLQFIGPFEAFLESRGHRLLPRSFRLHGNIVSRHDGAAVEASLVSELIATFFELQESWQVPILDAAEALAALSGDADVVFLSAMPSRYYGQRRRLLDSFGLPYPLIASEDAKGPLVDRLHGRRAHPVAFIDDMVRNLHSVGEHVPDCLLVHLQPDSQIHRLAPPTPDLARKARDWQHAGMMIRDHFAS